MRTSSLLLSIALTAQSVLASNVIDLTPSNFDAIVDSGKPALVEFFAPWYVRTFVSARALPLLHCTMDPMDGS
jgi:hypothetical protein